MKVQSFLITCLTTLLLLPQALHAVVYPTSTPIGEIPGGAFQTYFDNIFASGTTHQDCRDTSQVVGGFTSSGIPLCVTPSATGLNLSGSLGYTLYHNGTDWVSSNNIYNSGGFVGIGGVVPRSPFEVWRGTSSYIHFRGTGSLGIGELALPVTNQGDYNVALGQYALRYNSTGSQNTAIGRAALMNNTIGYNNSALGSSALFYNTGGFNNTAIGASSLYSNTTGFRNTGIGFSALTTNSTGFRNTAIGASSLYSNTTGDNNTAIGDSALTQNLAGSWNTAIGSSALTQNLAGSWNTALGVRVLQNNVSGNANVGIGIESLFSNTTATYNTAVGRRALYSIVSNGNNTAIGTDSLYTLTGGGDNVAIGYRAGYGQIGGSNTISIGANVRVLQPSVSNQLNIGDIIYGSNIGTASGQIVIGTGAYGTTAKLRVAGQVEIAGGGAASGKILIAKNANGLAEWGDVFASNVTSSGVIGGSGSYGYLVKFGSGGIGLELSTLYETGGFLGIGTTNPQSFIEVAQSGALYMHFRGTNTVALGKYSLGSLTTGLNNTALGYGALSGNTLGSYNVALGNEALNKTTNGVNNVAIGSQALYNTLSGTENVAIGRSALFANTTGNYNTALGSYSLASNTVGNYNIGFGFESLFSNTNGSNNVGFGFQSLRGGNGSFNLALGNQSLYSNQGSYNVGLGYNTLFSNTTGNYNVALGYQSLYNNNASRNVALGYLAMFANTTGYDNVALGVEAMRSNTTGLENVAVGDSTLALNTTGIRNTAVGNHALYNNITGDKNTAIGNYALFFNSSGAANAALGRRALYYNTTGNRNVGIGDQAAYQNTTGIDNVAIGNDSLYTNATGSQNIAIGPDSLEYAYSGMNTAIGSYAMNFLRGGEKNLAIGPSAMRYATGSSSDNIAIGQNALQGRFTGASIFYGNIAIGGGALPQLTTASDNIVIGNLAGFTLTTGSNNILIGSGVNTPTATSSNTLNIGNWIYGNGGKIGIGTGALSGVARLVVDGQVQITGGSPGSGRVLVSDSGGTAIWMPASSLDGVGGFNFPGDTDYASIDVVDKRGPNQSDMVFQMGDDGEFAQDRFVFQLDGYTGWPSGQPVPPCEFYTSKSGNNLKRCRYNGLTQRYPLIMDGTQALFFSQMATGTGNYFSGATAGNNPPNKSLGFGSGGGFSSALLFLDGDGKKVGIGTINPRSTLEIDSGVNNTSGLRLTRISPLSPLQAGNVVAVGVNGSGDIVPISPVSNIAVYTGVLRTTNLVPNPNLNNFEITYDFNRYFDIPGKQSFVVSKGDGPSYNGPYFRENGVSALCSWSGSYGTSPYDCATAGPDGLSASPNNSFTITAKGDNFGYQIALGARGDAPLFARSGRFNGSQTGGLYTNEGTYQTPAPWNKVLTVPANHPEYLYVNTGLNSQLQSQTGAGNVAIGTTTPASRFEVWTGASTTVLQHFRGSNVGLGLGAVRVQTTGTANTGLGNGALRTLSTGYNNTGLGDNALYGNTTGYFNAAGGSAALYANQGGNWNAAFGAQALWTNLGGSFNVALGGQALYYNSAGTNSVGLGYRALYAATGNGNIGIGSNAGSGITSGDNNIAIGNGVQVQSATASNQMNIGNWIYGNGGNIGIGTGANLNRRLVIDSGIANISGVRFTRINNTTPLFVSGPTTPVGVNGSGELVPVQGGMIPVYTALGGSPNAAINDAANPPTIGANYDRYFNVAARQSFVVTDVGGNPYNCPEFQLGSTNKGSTGCSQTPYATYVMTAQNATSGNRYGYQIMISDRTDAPFVVRGGMYSSANGTLMNTAMTSQALWFKAITVPTNRSDWFYINPGVDQNNNPIAGGGNIGIGTIAPTTTLDVRGNILTSSGFLGRASDSAVAPSYSWTGDTNVGIFRPATDVMAMATNGAERMRIESNGGVAIGTTSPVSRFEVWSGSTSFIHFRNTNTVFGESAFRNTTATGQYNVAIGLRALEANTAGGNNLALGTHALAQNVAGYNNTAIGTNSLYSLVGTGSATYNNIGIGMNSLFSNLSGTDNLAIGVQSLYQNQSGNYNIAIGTYAGTGQVSGNRNIAIGFGATVPNPNGSNQMNIGDILYASGLTSINGTVGIGTSNLNTPAKLKVAGQVEITGGSPGSGKVLVSDANGLASWSNYVPTNVNIGSGTANYIVRWNAAATGITNSIIYDDGQYLGIRVKPNEHNGVAFTGNMVTIDSLGSFGMRANVNQPGAYWDHFYFNHDGSSAFIDAGGVESGLAIRTGTGLGSYGLQNYREIARFLPNGNVGIGTSTPSNQLHVNGGAWFGVQAGSTDAILSNSANIVNIVSPTQLTTNVLTTPETAIRILRAGTSSVKYNPSADFQIGTYAAGINALTKLNIRLGNGTVQTPDVDVMTLQANGNVGIGNTAPNGQLQLSNSIQNRKIVLFETANNDHQYYGLGINSSILRYQVDSTTANHVFYAGTSTTTSNELMRIAGNGNVGIGTNGAASAKLDVRGTVKLGTNGSVLNNIIKTSVIADIPSIAANSSFTATVTVAGAMLGSSVIFSPQNALADGLIIQYTRVSAANTVEAKFRNTTGVAIDPPSMSYYISLIQ